MPDDVIDNAQKIIEQQTEDFGPLANVYLERMKSEIDNSRKELSNLDSEQAIVKVIIPCVQLKANGAMFKYGSVTIVADRCLNFLEVIKVLNDEALDILQVFHSTIKILLVNKIKKNNDDKLKALISELDKACKRFFEKNGTPPDS